MEIWMFRPPVLVGERIVWLGSGSGLPQGGVVRWIGKLPEIGPDWAVGLELDNPLPYGGIDGTWGNRYLFTCEPKHGLLVPISKIIRESDLFKWPYNSLAGTNFQCDDTNNPRPPARHRAPGRAADSAPQPPPRRPVIIQPRPAARRRRRFQVSAFQTLSVIPEPKEPEGSVISDDKSVADDIQSQTNKENCRPYYGSLKSLRSLRSVNTFITCQSGECSDYQWFDADEDDDDICDFQDCKSGFYEPVTLKENVKSDIYSVVVKKKIEIDNKVTNEQSDVTQNHGAVETERMTEFKGHVQCNYQENDSSLEAAVTGAGGVYLDTSQKRSSLIATPSTPTGSTSRRDKGASGFFSFLRWFRKGKDEDGDGEDGNEKVGESGDGIFLPPTPLSVRLIRTQSSSCGSIDTLFSTATVNSFSFVAPTSYRPYGNANPPEKWIAPGPDTDTYRNRLVHRDRVRELDRNLTLRKKYRLFGSDTQLRSGFNSPEASPLLGIRHITVVTPEVESKDQSKVLPPTSSPGSSNSTFGRKKRRAPVPPDLPRPQYNDYSLPNSWEHKGKGKNQCVDNSDEANLKKPRHRRTASESSKDKKAGAYCHVKGKRRAPPPPTQENNTDQQSGSTLDRFKSQFASFGRKKRPAPQPPATQDKPKEEEGAKRKKDQETQASSGVQDNNKTTLNKLSPEDKERLIANIAKLKAHANRKSMGSPPPSPKDMHLGFRSAHEQVVCNDSLKLERGVLKPNKELPKMECNTTETKPAPVSPRPWYKRSLSTKDSSIGGIKRDIFKSLEKKKDRDKEKDEDWMPEVGFPRIGSTSVPSDGNSTSSTSSRFNIFSRLDKSDEKKREGEKRKSQVSMLANISELDREAAEIVQKEQAREQALMAAQDAKFYSYPDTPGYNQLNTDVLDGPSHEPVSENVEVPKRSSAKELISLFNAIGNVTKVTVNSAFFSKDGSSIFTREGIEKRFSFMGESVRTTDVVISESKSFTQQEVTQKKQTVVINSQTPLVNSPGAQKRHVPANGIDTTTDGASGVTIEEVDDDDVDKSSRVRAMYEANKSRRHISPSPNIPTIAEQSESTTPASTINPGSKRDSMIEETPTSDNVIPEPLQHAKKIAIWACPRCTLENPRWKLTCDACGRWRPSVPDSKVEPVTTEEPVSPLSPQPQVTKHNKKPDNGKLPIDWEEELKRYFPSGSKEGNENTKTETIDNSQIIKADVTKQNTTSAVTSKTVASAQIEVKVQQKNTSITESQVSRNAIDTKTKNAVPSEKEPKHFLNTAMPSTFIGGRTKQDEEKQKAAVAKPVSKVNGIQETSPPIEEPDVHEVRKARLAFFHRPEGNPEDNCKDNSSVVPPKRNSTTSSTIESNFKLSVKPETIYSGGLKLPSDENEKLKLKEMLKEMKDSLPKHDKRAAATNKNKDLENVRNSKNLENVNEVSNAINNIKNNTDGKIHGAIKKIPRQSPQVAKQNSVNHVTLNGTDEKNNMASHLKNGINDEAEAVFITSKTIYEETKVRKYGLSKPPKVSTSSQTSSVVKKLDSLSDSEKQIPDCEAAALPVTVEELSTVGVKDGVLYTSLGKQSQRIGSRTFELIRARDFANIEATKTGSDIVVTHLYANLPPSPACSPSTKQQHASTEKDSPVFPSQQKSPLSVQKTSSSSKSGSTLAQTIPPPEKEEKSDNKPLPLLEVRHDKQSSVTDSSQTASGTTSPSKGEVHQASLSGAGSEASSYSIASAGSSENSEVERLTAQLTLPKGLADFKADLEAALPEQNMNTLAVNRLLRRLEAAIAGGQHQQAACLAKDLARLKISCSVTRQRRSLDSSPASIMVDMYVEDKVSHQGPIPLQVVPAMTVAELKQKVEQEFEIPIGVQRWILGKLLASDDSKTLEDHNVNTNGCPMFLYLVAPDGEQESEPTATKQQEPEATPVVLEPPAAQNGGGWYYNQDEEHYSFCEDTESEMTEDDDDDDEDNNIENVSGRVLEMESVKPPQKLEVRKEVEEEESEEEEIEEEEEEEEESEEEEVALVAPAAVIIHEKPVVVEPQLPQILKSVRPVINHSPKPFRSEAASGSSTHPTKQEKPDVAESKTGTMKLGWKCQVCTLVNSPTRPGCAVCTTERPLQYVVPIEYRANQQELERMKREQQLDNELHQAEAQEKQQVAENQHQHYMQLVNLDNAELVPNVEPFDCSVCLTPYNAGEGVVLRECLHTFCKPCLVNTIQFNEEAEVKCPYRDADYACNSVFQEREIKSLVPPNVYEQHLAKSVTQAENKIGNAFHCKTPDCRGWCIFEDNVNEFRCPVCRVINCLTCQAIHEGVNCKQYQEQVQQQSETNAEARQTKEMLQEMVVRGEAMACPTCQVVLMKKWGCDWLRCSMCKTEICWVTRGPRWGPGGKGDTTGGCQCGVNGVKCHPRCNYCH